MGDWCSEEVTDSLTQRNCGNGIEALNQGVEHARLSSARKDTFFLAKEKFFT